MSDEPIPSPFDRFPGEFIEASVVDDCGGDEIRILGYELGSDLAPHYDTIEILLSLFLGELPANAAIGQAFSMALRFAMPLSVADGAVHATRLGRHLATIADNDATVVTLAAVAVSEHSRHEIEGLAELLAWLEEPGAAELPACAKAASAADVRYAADLRRLIAAEYAPPAVFDAGPGRVAAAVAVMHACGVREPQQLIAALTAVRIPVAMAEAYGVSDPRIWSYPLNLPRWDYSGARAAGPQGEPERPTEEP